VGERTAVVSASLQLARPTSRCFRSRDILAGQVTAHVSRQTRLLLLLLLAVRWPRRQASTNRRRNAFLPVALAMAPPPLQVHVLLKAARSSSDCNLVKHCPVLELFGRIPKMYFHIPSHLTCFCATWGNKKFKFPTE